MRYEKESFLSSEFSCWRAVLYNDTGQPLSLLAQPRRSLNPGILSILASNLSRNKTWVTLCLHGRPRLGIYKHSRSPLCISILLWTGRGRVWVQGKHLGSRRPPPLTPLKFLPQAPRPFFCGH